MKVILKNPRLVLFEKFDVKHSVTNDVLLLLEQCDTTKEYDYVLQTILKNIQ